MDIMKIPTDELRRDLDETYGDIITCEAALRLGITRYPSGSVRERLETNEKIKDYIKKELARREAANTEVNDNGRNN
ncbi:MAG: hypothetical protein KAT00_04730 [Planctomycetes bacterium]|nr:hypothetical protein [Planctomycetota bacterium]